MGLSRARGDTPGRDGSLNPDGFAPRMFMDHLGTVKTRIWNFQRLLWRSLGPMPGRMRNSIPGMANANGARVTPRSKFPNKGHRNMSDNQWELLLQNYLEHTAQRICVPLWGRDKFERHFVYGFMTEKVRRWHILPEGQGFRPITDMGIMQKDLIWMDCRGRITLPAGENFRCGEDAIAHLNRCET